MIATVDVHIRIEGVLYRFISQKYAKFVRLIRINKKAGKCKKRSSVAQTLVEVDVFYQSMSSTLLNLLGESLTEVLYTIMYIRSIFIRSINHFHAREHISTQPHCLILVQNRSKFDLGTYNNQSLKLIQTLQNALKRILKG